MPDPVVPRRAERLLEALGADPDFRDAVLGDLTEEFATRLRWDGDDAARRWYRREALRVAPYFLRDWRVRLGPATGVGVAGVVLGATASTLVLDAVLRQLLPALVPVLRSVLPAALPASSPLVAALLVLTLADGTLAGYVAARLGRRAPLPGALAAGLASFGLMVWSGAHHVPGWFLAANAATMLVGALAGGVLRACTGRVARSLPLLPDHA